MTVLPQGSAGKTAVTGDDLELRASMSLASAVPHDLRPMLLAGLHLRAAQRGLVKDRAEGKAATHSPSATF